MGKGKVKIPRGGLFETGTRRVCSKQEHMKAGNPIWAGWRVGAGDANRRGQRSEGQV
jgi:hypothetical protein